MQRPLADIEISIDLAREILREQHPDLATLTLAALDEGWDNILFRLGCDLIVRFPRRQLAVALMRHEQRWLAEIARRCSMALPAPVRIGEPSQKFPYPWSVVPWIEGTPGDRVATFDQSACAAALGGFLRELHIVAPLDAPKNEFRGGALGLRGAIFAERCQMVEAELDLRPIRAAFDLAVNAAPWTQPRRWLHGDLHPANMIFRNGQLVGVVDFGDMCAGDPATDLAGAWMLLEQNQLEGFFETYGDVDSTLRARSRGWAALFGVLFLSIGISGRATYETIGRRTLDLVAET